MSEIPGQSGHVLPDLEPPVCANGRHTRAAIRSPYRRTRDTLKAMSTASPQKGNPTHSSHLLWQPELDADCLFQRCDPIKHFLEALVDKKSLFLLHEVLSHGLLFVRRDDILELREEVRVLPCGVRPVYGDEGLHGTDKLAPVLALLAARRSELKDGVGYDTSGQVLREQVIHQIDHFPRLLEARKHLLLFRFLVIVFDEVTHDQRRTGEDVGIEILASGELPHC